MNERQGVDLPPVGESRRVEHAGWQLVLERRRGGLSLLAHDGRSSRRYLLGVPAAGTFELRVAAPRHPVRVQLDTDCVVVGGGRLRGYLVVPVPVEVAWATGSNGSVAHEVLAELMPAGLQTAWREGEGYAHVVHSALVLEVPDRVGEAEAVVPVVLHNAAERAVQPDELVVRLAPDGLRRLRGRIVAAPRRLVFEGEGWRERVRPFLVGVR